MLEVPPDGDIFSLHQGIACCVADGEQAAAHAAAQGNEVPVLTVLDEALQVFCHSTRTCIQHGKDGYAADDEGDVVHDGADCPKHEREDVDVVDVLVAPPGDGVHGSHFDEDIYAETYTEEEHNHLNYFVLQASVRRGSMKWLVGEDALAVDDFVYHPKHSKHAEGSEEGRQVREAVERRHKPESSHAEDEHQNLLPKLDIGVVASEHDAAALEVEVAGEFSAYEESGDDCGEECRQDECGSVVGGCHGSARPDEQGGDIADDRKAAAAVGGNDDDGAKQHPLSMIHNKLVHDHKHHDGSGQVVEVGTQQEAAQGEQPDGCPRASGAAEVRHEVEAAVVPQHLHNCHSREQVHDDARQLGDVAGKDILPYVLIDSLDAIVLTAKEFLEAGIMERLDVIGAYADVEHPSPNAAEDGDGGFVDAGDVLRADEQVAEQHQGDNRDGHSRELKIKS